MFRMYVRERYTGLRSDTEFAVEALLCTWWYGLYFAILRYAPTELLQLPLGLAADTLLVRRLSLSVQSCHVRDRHAGS